MQVKINPYIDSAEKEKLKASTRQKVKSKCTGSASLSCPVGLAAMSEQRVINDIMSLWEASRRLTPEEMARPRWGKKDGKETDVWVYISFLFV